VVATAVWINDAGIETLLAIAANVPDWQRDAACAEDQPGADWFPDQGGHGIRAAKVVCARCLVQAECLAYAVDLGNELPGVWGGTSQIDRKQLRKRGVTGAMVARFGARVDEGRQVVLDEASMFCGLLEADD
jgi:WhiB family redox-sensing transcriptional regulator